MASCRHTSHTPGCPGNCWQYLVVGSTRLAAARLGPRASIPSAARTPLTITSFRQAMGLDEGVDPIRVFLGTALTEARQLILNDSEHQRLTVRHARLQGDIWRITVMCHACEKKWTTSFDPDQLISHLPDRVEKEIVRRWVAPLVEIVCRASCFEVVEAALLAEWLTRRLVAAGPKGMPYVQVIHDAVEARLCSPKDVDQVLRTMDMVPEWVTLGSAGVILPGGWDGAWTLPILHLPDGHPLKTW